LAQYKISVNSGGNDVQIIPTAVIQTASNFTPTPTMAPASSCFTKPWNPAFDGEQEYNVDAGATCITLTGLPVDHAYTSQMPKFVNANISIYGVQGSYEMVELPTDSGHVGRVILAQIFNTGQKVLPMNLWYRGDGVLEWTFSTPVGSDQQAYTFIELAPASVIG